MHLAVQRCAAFQLILSAFLFFCWCGDSVSPWPHAPAVLRHNRHSPLFPSEFNCTPRVFIELEKISDKVHSCCLQRQRAGCLCKGKYQNPFMTTTSVAMTLCSVQTQLIMLITLCSQSNRVVCRPLQFYQMDHTGCFTLGKKQISVVFDNISCFPLDNIIQLFKMILKPAKPLDKLMCREGKKQKLTVHFA